MAGLHFDITGDNSNFIRKLHECENGVKNASKQIGQSGLGIEDLFNRMTRAAAAFGAGFTTKELISNIAKVRGEFQQLEVAFKTMLGSEDKANALMQQLVKTAATTPFDLQGVANGAKQLLAYGENVENVNDDLIRLGNIAAGLSQPLGDIVYLYGTTMTQGRLYTQDLNQFTGRGIPMIRELAKVFGVAEGEVKSLVEAGKVGFPEVQKVIQNLTNEGGMFYNLMQEQSKTITGQISNIEDAISTMFNEIGKANEGIINDALSGVSYLVENYEKVGQILIEIVGTYGAYRTALMVTSALQALQASGITALTAKEAAHYGWLVLTKKAQDALNLSMLKNPYVLAAAAIAGLAYGIYKLATAESETEKAIRETNNALEAQKSHYDDLKNKAGELSNILSNESKSIEERFIAYRQLQRLMPEVFQNMDWETAKRKTNAELIKLETDEMLRQQRIGLKTKVVMSQQKVQGLENSIIRTTNRGGYTGALKEDLAAAKKELEIYTKALEDFEKADEQAKKESEKPVIFNKKYWEGQKKEAEDALNSIASSQKKMLDAGKFEGIDASVIKSYKDNTKKLKEAEKELKVYDTSSKRESAADKQKKEQQKTAEELLSLRRQNQQAEIDLMKEGKEKRLKQIDLDYQKELDTIKKQEKELSEKQKGKLTSEQSIEISNRYTNAENKRDKAIADITKEQLKAEQQALNDYLKEYGTFQQKKEAITKEYNDKIANATTEGDKKILQKQMEEALSSVDMDKLKQEINWELIFSDLNKVSKKSLEQVKQQLKTFKNSDEYKNMAVNQKKVIDEALNNIQSTIIDKGGLLGDLPEQLDALRIAQDELKQAQDEYNKSLKSGTDAEKEAALKKKNKAEKNVQNAETNVTRSADKTYQNLITLADTITQLGSSSEMSLSQIGSLASGLIDTFTEAGSKIGGIVGAVFSLLDGIEKQGFDGFVKNVFSSVFGAGASMWNTITFGGFNKLFGIGGNAKEVQEAIDRLTDRNETLEKSIDRLTDVMEKSAGSKSISAYEQAYKYQQEQITNTLKIAQEQARYSGSHHSWQYYMEWTDEQLRWARENVDKNFSGTGSLWGLSPEQMKTLLSNADISEQIRNEGKGGYGGRVLEKLEAYADQAGKLDELTEKINESLMQISFDGLRDNFFESLMDMDKDAKSFSEDFSEYMQRALLNFSMGELFDDELRGWYNGIAKLMKEQGGKLTKQQLEDARKEYDVMVQDAMNERDKIAEITGYTGSSSSSSQEASKKVSASVTQDSIDELSGRFTALQIAGEEIKNQMIAVMVGVNSFIGISSAGNETLSNILNQHVITNSYLEDITKYTKLLNDIRADISEVKVNTKGLSTR